MSRNQAPASTCIHPRECLTGKNIVSWNREYGKSGSRERRRLPQSPSSNNDVFFRCLATHVFPLIPAVFFALPAALVPNLVVFLLFINLLFPVDYGSHPTLLVNFRLFPFIARVCLYFAICAVAGDLLRKVNQLRELRELRARERTKNPLFLLQSFLPSSFKKSRTGPAALQITS